MNTMFGRPAGVWRAAAGWAEAEGYRGHSAAALLCGVRAGLVGLDGDHGCPQVVERVNRIITGANVRQVYEVPYDAHIAERGQLTLDSLAPATRQAFTSAAAGVVSYLQQSVR